MDRQAPGHVPARSPRRRPRTGTAAAPRDGGRRREASWPRARRFCAGRPRARPGACLRRWTRCATNAACPGSTRCGPTSSFGWTPVEQSIAPRPPPRSCRSAWPSARRPPRSGSSMRCCSGRCRWPLPIVSSPSPPRSSTPTSSPTRGRLRLPDLSRLLQRSWRERRPDGDRPPGAPAGDDPDAAGILRSRCDSTCPATRSALGLQPALGRLLGPADDVTPGGHPVAVLSYDYWTRRFNRDPGVIGKTLLAGSLSLEIVGVAPRGLHGHRTGRRDGLVPAGDDERTGPQQPGLVVVPDVGAAEGPASAASRFGRSCNARYRANRGASLRAFPADTPKERIDEFLNRSRCGCCRQAPACRLFRRRSGDRCSS